MELIKFIEDEILPHAEPMTVHKILMSGENYFKEPIYKYLTGSDDDDRIHDIQGYLMRVWR